jgi:hypothetical protein
LEAALLPFLEFVGMIVVVGVALTTVIQWIVRKHPRWRGPSAFVVAFGAAYAASLALDVFIGAFVGFYPFTPFTPPVWTWSGIAIALHSLARFASGGPSRWIQLPYLGIGGFAAMTGFLGPHKHSIAVGAPLILFALCSAFFSERATAQNKNVSARHIFPVGKYKLDAPVAGLSDLKEFSPTEYSALRHTFEGETVYDTPPVIFLGRSWQLQLGTVHGKIYKIASYLLLKDKQDANAAAMESLRYCTAELGKPVERGSGLFVWHASDGNVVLQTGELADDFCVNIFLTSKSVMTFKQK